MLKIKNQNPIVLMVKDSLIDLPTPSMISNWWNLGSLLGVCLSIQIMTGLFLAMHFTSDMSTAFDSVEHIMRDVSNGWLLRMVHANGASMFFVCLYLHIFRGVYYSSFYLLHTWLAGVSLMFLVMATAFVGYVLPWGQMSFWGATVITNLLSAIPYLGQDIVQWVWGGFAVGNATLTRFFALHFILPFVIAAFVIIHLMFLHQSGSSNPLGINSNLDKIPFQSFHTWKDSLGALVMITSLILICLMSPNLLGDVENFTPANPMVTPPHIQPEWYFLFAYAILRSIPNKLGGVIALVASIAILFILPLIPKTSILGTQFYPLTQIILWTMLNVMVMLTWIGAQPVEEPFIFIGQVLTISYFLGFIVWPTFNHLWDTLKL